MGNTEECINQEDTEKTGQNPETPQCPQPLMFQNTLPNMGGRKGGKQDGGHEEHKDYRKQKMTGQAWDLNTHKKYKSSGGWSGDRPTWGQELGGQSRNCPDRGKSSSR